MTFYGFVSEVYMNSTLISNFFSHSLFKYMTFSQWDTSGLFSKHVEHDDRFFFELQGKNPFILD